MNEPRLRELMTDATGDPPPATFDVDDVRAASWRVTWRHRRRVASGAVVVVLLLACAVISGSIAGAGGADSRRASSSAAGAPPAGTPRNGTAATENSPGPEPKQGGNGSRGDGPSRAGRTSRCDKVGRELVDALEDELPATDDASVPRCDPEGHAVSVQVDDGTVTAWLSPGKDSDAGNQPQPPGAFRVIRRTSVGTLTVMSIAGAQEYAAPLSDRLPRIATAVANAL